MASEITMSFTAKQGLVIDNYKRLTSIHQRHGRGTQALRIFGTTIGTSATPIVLRFVLRDSKGAIAYFDVTFTCTAVRTGPDGASGGYVCSVSCAESGNSKFDLLGASDASDPFWTIGLVNDLPNGVTQLDLSMATTSVI